MYVPESFVENMFGNNRFGVLMAAIVGVPFGVPLYVCDGGTI